MNAIILGNSLVRKAGQSIWDQRVINSNIDKVLCLVHPARKRFLYYEELVQSYGQVIDPLTYYSLLGSLSRLWKIIIKSTDWLHEIDLPEKREFWLKESSKLVSNRMYWYLQEASDFTDRSALKTKWDVENVTTDMTTDDWWALFPDFMQCIKPVKLHFLQYRILTQALTTNI